MSGAEPSSQVLQAFGVSGPVAPLSGGRNLCFTADNVVFKPCDHDAESQWLGQLLTRLSESQPTGTRYRVARPKPLANDATQFVYEGWTASAFLPGRDGPDGRFSEILQISQSFHLDVAALVPEKPSFIGTRRDRYEFADLVTWGERTLDDVPGVNKELLAYFDAPLRELRQMMKPLPSDLPSQLIHGDLTGNVLFDDEGGAPPGIIDVVCYWHPAAYAKAIVVADGLAWHAQGRRLVELYGLDELHLQLLARALHWRCITFAIDSDMDWIRSHIAKSDYPGAVCVLRDVMADI
ncbi:hypothetical protein JDV02_002355 [Purpureocillium takamizusanense]|uniref:Aminoglycoside phosphotransferase domain-containing protein n=1 Tax=Purpureocillium takamizusanense TaxID=2060973 RepID=A0A9Q8Q8J8_9HYPO|nr:uncharacterized protein JDV02_002355 [Purpureocillium takamizusanense]UNI15864.1 hypothetical protein JDV02_002355 [Purpureocillium takamizusanense]